MPVLSREDVDVALRMPESATQTFMSDGSCSASSLLKPFHLLPLDEADCQPIDFLLGIPRHHVLAVLHDVQIEVRCIFFFSISARSLA
jgi:hypothetical protein